MSWDAVVDPGLQSYNVRYGASAQGPWDYIVTDKSATTASAVVQHDTNYHVQIAAVDRAGNVGTYVNFSGSPILSAKDTTPPAQVTGLVVTQQGSSFVLNWNALTDVDFDTYEISVTNGANERFFYPGTSTRFELTYGVNKNAFGTPVSSADFKVRGRDTSKNNGAWSTIVSSSFGTPSAPTSLTNTPGANSVSMEKLKIDSSSPFLNYITWLIISQLSYTTKS